MNKRELKLFLVNFKGGKCSRCGYDKCTGALEFHHLYDNKNDTISKLISDTEKSLTKLAQEIDKCVLLCANCHRELHYAENTSNKNYITNRKLSDENIKEIKASLQK